MSTFLLATNCLIEVELMCQTALDNNVINMPTCRYSPVTSAKEVGRGHIHLLCILIFPKEEDPYRKLEKAFLSDGMEQLADGFEIARQAPWNSILVEPSLYRSNPGGIGNASYSPHSSRYATSGSILLRDWGKISIQKLFHDLVAKSHLDNDIWKRRTKLGLIGDTLETIWTQICLAGSNKAKHIMLGSQGNWMLSQTPTFSSLLPKWEWRYNVYFERASGDIPTPYQPNPPPSHKTPTTPTPTTHTDKKSTTKSKKNHKNTNKHTPNKTTRLDQR